MFCRRTSQFRKQIKYTNENNLTNSAVFESHSDQKNIGRSVAKILRERKRIIDTIQINKDLPDTIINNIPNGTMGRGGNP